MLQTAEGREAVSLEEVLASEREDAAVLRRRGYARDADLIDALLDRVRLAAEDYITWLSEAEACVRSAERASYFKRRFPAWLAAGHARVSARGVREYRMCIVPGRAHESAAAEAGRRAGREDAMTRGARRGGAA